MLFYNADKITFMQNIYQNFSKFLIVGALSFVVDILFYFFFLKQGIDPVLSKLASFICGAFCGYILNTYFTFNQAKLTSNKLLKYISVYSCSLFANLLSNELMLTRLLNSSMEEGVYFISVIFATVIALVINFLGLRYYVFRF